jgi:cell division protein FtsQ
VTREAGMRRGGGAGLRARPGGARREPAVDAAAPQRVARNRRVLVKPAEPSGPSLLERARGIRAAISAGVLRNSAALRRLRRGALVLMVLGLSVLIGTSLNHYMRTNAAFAIDTIDIEGTTRIERGELLEAAGVDLGTNIFAKSPDEIRHDLLAHDWVQTAEVTRRPPGKLQIRIVERQPVALLVVDACQGLRSEETECDEGSSLHLVSDDGKVFKRFDSPDPVDLPVITGVDRERYGNEPEFARELLMTAVALIHAYQADDLSKRFPLGEIHVEQGQAFSLYVGEDLTLVRLGVSPYGAKLRRMKKVFEQLEHEHARAEYVYLDNEERPDRVAVRLR